MLCRAQTPPWWVLDKAQFWQRWAGTPMNTRQTLVLNRVLDGMEGKLTNAKWAAIGKCSADTALRDINDLLARGVLRRLEGGGRSAGYTLETRSGPWYQVRGIAAPKEDMDIIHARLKIAEAFVKELRK